MRRPSLTAGEISPSSGGGPSSGLLLMLGATIAFTAMQAAVKLLRDDGFATSEIIFYRSAPALPFLWWGLRRRKIPLRPARVGVIALRSAFGIASMATNFFAVRALTLVQHTVLFLLQPVFVALLAPLALREPLRAVTLAALALALSGAALVIHPDAAAFAPPLLPALLSASSALFSALAHLSVRVAAASEPAERVVFHFTLHASLAGLAWGLAEGAPHDLELADLPALVGLVGFGTLGQVLMTRAYHREQAARVAMIAYAGIPASVALDAWLWRAPAGVGALAGAGLMVVAGALLQRARPQPGQP